MYQLISNSTNVRHLPTGTVFNMPATESFGFAYQQWLNEGNTPEAAPLASAAVPEEVTMRQARRALHAAGLLPQVEAAINSLPEPPRTEAMIDWNFSNVVQRRNGFVAQLQAGLNLTDEMLDALFISAATFAE